MGCRAWRPFFGFNYWFVFVTPMFNAWMALDVAANTVVLFLCWLGWRASAPAAAGS